MKWIERQRRQAKQLGMPISTARAILCKEIMFQLARKCGMDKCFECGASIEHKDQLSIEHMEPWEGRKTSLYWEFENIAFSHSDCNRVRKHEKSSLRKVGPEGTSWCSACRRFLDKDSFHADGSRWNGLNGKCKPCVGGENHWRKKQVL